MVAVPSIGRADRSVGNTAPAEADAHRLYEQYARQIQAYCFHQLGSREEAEDATQSTFLNAFRGLQRGVSPEFEMAWLYKIAHNVCLTRRRSSSRRRRVETAGDLEALQDIIPAPEVDSDELIGLPEALNGMPKQQQRALLLREWQGLSYREIATELGISQAAVETLLFRARRSLAAGLEEEPKKGIAKRVVKGGDAGSLLTLFKSLLVTGGTKVAATVATVAATSVVAATPAARHAVENAAAFTSADSHRPAVPAQTTHSAPVRHAAVVGTKAPVRVRTEIPGRRKHAVTHTQRAAGAFEPRSVVAPRTRALVTGGDVAPPIVAVPPTPATDPGAGDPTSQSGSTPTTPPAQPPTPAPATPAPAQTPPPSPTSSSSSGGNDGAQTTDKGNGTSGESGTSGQGTTSGQSAGKGNTQQQVQTSSGQSSTGTGSVSTNHGPGPIAIQLIAPTATTPTTTTSTPTTTTQAPATTTTPTVTTPAPPTTTTAPPTASPPALGVPHHH